MVVVQTAVKSQKQQNIDTQNEAKRLQTRETERLNKLVKAANLVLKKANDYPK